MPSIKLSASATDIYTLDMLCQEAEARIAEGQIRRTQTISTLCHYLPRREWEGFAMVLEEHGFLLRDRILDLFPQKAWEND